jgi:hypothetical protein
MDQNSAVKAIPTLVACGIFKQELSAVLEPELGGENLQIVWVDAALHCDLDRLAAELNRAFAAAKRTGDDVRLLFGQNCHPDINSLARNCGIRTSPVKNCIDAFLGEKVKSLEENRTLIMTPTWIRTWPRNAKILSGWNEVDFRMNLGRYARILVIDPGLNSLSDEEVLDFFDLVQVPVEVVPLDLGLFRDTVASLLG